MEIPKEIGSKYRFIVLAGMRVAQLQKGAVPRVDLGKTAKLTTLAMREILENKIGFRKMDAPPMTDTGETQPEEPPTLES